MDLTESEVNLNLGRHVGRVLQERGYRTLLTRDGDYRLNGEWADVNEDGTTDHVDEVQARVDAINAAKVDLVLSIHQNAFYHQSGEAGVELGGTITFYCADRPFADQSLLFAQLTQQALVAAFRELGYEIRDRGVEDDAVLSVPGEPGDHLILLGPEADRIVRPSEAPGILSETLFLTNDREAKLAADPRALNRLAEAYADAVDSYFERYPSLAKARPTETPNGQRQ